MNSTNILSKIIKKKSSPLFELFNEESKIKRDYNCIRFLITDANEFKKVDSWLLSLQSSLKIALLERENINIFAFEIDINRNLTYAEIDAFPKNNNCEIFILPPTLPVLNKKGLLVMDMDSTAIKIECIDELAAMACVGQEVAMITERAMQGELDFCESLKERVNLLKGAPADIINKLYDQLPFMSGLELMTQTLLSYNWILIIASGGFTNFAKKIQNELGFAQIHANTLEVKDGKLTGKVIGKIIDSKEKENILNLAKDTYNIEANQTLAIGDGANDLPMLKASDLGIAFHGKPKLTNDADISINKLDLTALVFMLQKN